MYFSHIHMLFYNQALPFCTHLTEAMAASGDENVGVSLEEEGFPRVVGGDVRRPEVRHSEEIRRPYDTTSTVSHFTCPCKRPPPPSHQLQS